MKSAQQVTREKILALIESEYDSDAAFEREMELPPKTVNNWRRGRSASYMKMLPRLAESFDVSVGELLDLPIRGDSSELSEDELSLLEKYRSTSSLAPKSRLLLLRTLESVMDMYLEGCSEPKTKRSKKY